MFTQDDLNDIEKCIYIDFRLRNDGNLHFSFHDEHSVNIDIP